MFEIHFRLTHYSITYGYPTVFEISQLSIQLAVKPARSPVSSRGQQTSSPSNQSTRRNEIKDLFLI